MCLHTCVFVCSCAECVSALCASVYTYTRVHTCPVFSVHVFLCACIHLYFCMCVFSCTHVYMCVCICICVHVFVCVSVCLHVCIMCVHCLLQAPFQPWADHIPVPSMCLVPTGRVTTSRAVWLGKNTCPSLHKVAPHLVPFIDFLSGWSVAPPVTQFPTEDTSLAQPAHMGPVTGQGLQGRVSGCPCWGPGSRGPGIL